MLCAGKTGKEVRYASISLPRRGRRPWHAQKLLITRCGRLSTQATRLSGRRGRGVFLALQLHLWTVRETRHFGVGTVFRPPGVRGGDVDAGHAAARQLSMQAVWSAGRADAHAAALAPMVAGRFSVHGVLAGRA